MKRTFKIRRPVAATAGVREPKRVTRRGTEDKHALARGEAAPLCGASLVALEARLASINGPMSV